MPPHQRECSEGNDDAVIGSYPAAVLSGRLRCRNPPADPQRRHLQAAAALPGPVRRNGRPVIADACRASSSACTALHPLPSAAMSLSTYSALTGGRVTTAQGGPYRLEWTPESQSWGASEACRLLATGGFTGRLITYIGRRAGGKICEYRPVDHGRMLCRVRATVSTGSAGQ